MGKSGLGDFLAEVLAGKKDEFVGKIKDADKIVKDFKSLLPKYPDEESALAAGAKIMAMKKGDRARFVVMIDGRVYVREGVYMGDEDGNPKFLIWNKDTKHLWKVTTPWKAVFTD